MVHHRAISSSNGYDSKCKRETKLTKTNARQKKKINRSTDPAERTRKTYRNTRRIITILVKRFFFGGGGCFSPLLYVPEKNHGSFVCKGAAVGENVASLAPIGIWKLEVGQ